MSKNITKVTNNILPGERTRYREPADTGCMEIRLFQLSNWLPISIY